MRTAAICPTCATYTNALCVIYNGPGLTNTNVAPLDDLETVIQKINNNLVPVSGTGSPTNSAVYEGQVYIDNATSQVYIAVATGGGAGDWEEVYTTANPPIPPVDGIDDVLGVGQLFSANRSMNIDTHSYTIKSDTYPIGLFQIDDTNGVIFIGDFNGSVNSTYIDMNDSVGDINIIVSNAITVNGDNIVRSVNGVIANTSGDVALSKYKVYTAVISQTGILAPTVDYTLENTLSGTPTWGYSNVGNYTLTLSNEWVNNKTIVFINPGYIPQGFTIGWERNSSSTLTVHVRDAAGNYTDALLFKASIEVRVYN